jgi:hypothetical protein
MKTRRYDLGDTYTRNLKPLIFSNAHFTSATASGEDAVD